MSGSFKRQELIHSAKSAFFVIAKDKIVDGITSLRVVLSGGQRSGVKYHIGNDLEIDRFLVNFL